MGPTASSKTALAANLAYRLDTEVIGADSRQVYRKMDLGTGKDYGDYIIEGKEIPFHLIDIADAGYKYNVFEYQRDFLTCWNGIQSRNKIPILCGGTGMYIEAVLKGYKLIQVPVNDTLRNSLADKSMDELTQILSGNKKTHNTSDADTVKRAIRAIEIAAYYACNPETDSYYPEIKSLIIGVNFDRESRRMRISQRLKTRLNEGMVDEVKALLDSGITKDDLIYYGLEYKFLTLYICGDLSFNEMHKQLETAIHQFAKRQMTWFRGMERKGFKINWLEGSMPLEDKLDIIMKLVEVGG